MEEELSEGIPRLLGQEQIHALRFGDEGVPVGDDRFGFAIMEQAEGGRFEQLRFAAAIELRVANEQFRNGGGVGWAEFAFSPKAGEFRNAFLGPPRRIPGEREKE